MAVNENLLERREHKYHLPPHLVPYVRETALSVCKLDSYAGPNGSYAIRSLYFDTDQYALFWANDHEVCDRFKVRARMYPGAQGKAPVFLEVKRRVLDAIIKTRGGVPAEQWQEVMCHPNGEAASRVAPKARRAVERFNSLVHTYHLKPVVLVEYDREAYVSTVDDYARLTFDRHIRCQLKSTLDMEVDPKAWRLVDDPIRTKSLEPITLLELKFAGPAPRWMMNMVQRLELIRYSFSKYGYSLDVQHSVPGVRIPTYDEWRLGA
ncbi:MAG: polyphosphate polymerase domain-containing protein [Myxococcota bacterium]